MDSSFVLLLATAASIGVVHTLLGPDHYLPFVAMGRAGQWSGRRVVWVTVLCGLGHVGSSVVLGLLGVSLGWTLGSMEAIESVRGQWAAWSLIAIGITYGAWGVRRALRGRSHRHPHRHADGTVHDHDHGHEHEHAHVHTQDQARLTPWVLFIAFVLGPCEPLIPLLMVPALSHGTLQISLVVAVFAASTLATMLFCVWILWEGLDLLPSGALERWSHATAGFAVFACGSAMAFLGL